MALVDVGVERMRPIAITTFAAILALLSLALALGEGAGMQPPLTVAIISGLLAEYDDMIKTFRCAALQARLGITHPFFSQALRPLCAGRETSAARYSIHPDGLMTKPSFA